MDDFNQEVEKLVSNSRVYLGEPTRPEQKPAGDGSACIDGAAKQLR